MHHFLIISADFYKDIADEMVQGATAYLDAHKASYDAISVPGAFEIPGAIALAMQTGKYQGYVALGCVIRGETTHYDYVCGESARGLMDLTVYKHAAIGNGILTVENRDQAWARARVREGNKGKAAAAAALRMVVLKNEFEDV